MKAARENKCKRVVITSSTASITVTHKKATKVYFSEEDWSDLSHCNPYEKSKTMAEKAAWDFLEALPDNEKFELVSLNPSLILGPNMVTEEFTSGDFIRKLMTGAIPGMPKVTLPIVDVRDAAKAHLQALKVPEAANKRFIICSRTLWMKEIAEILKKEFSANYKINTSELKLVVMKVGACFDKSAKMLLPKWKKVYEFDHTLSEKILKI